jgi:diguanylate cyclase (GGDEF)-like protein
MDAMPTALLLTDASDRCIDANRAALRLLGCARAAVIGRDVGAFLPEVMGLRTAGTAPVSDVPAELGEARLRRVGDSELRVALSLAIVPTTTPAQPVFAYFFRDITAEVARLARLRAAARTDPLTGLLNRAALEAALDRTLRSISRGASPAVLCFLDLDHFKAVNDRYGHAAGDRVLRDLAGVLRRRLRATDVAGRIGGDEFALILPGCSTADTMRLMEMLRQRMAAFAKSLPVGCAPGFSAGITVLTAHTASVATALAEADRACYAAKAAGRAQAQVFAAA